MVIKILILSIFAISCGPDVSISSSKMKENSEQNSLQYGQTNGTGLLIRGVPDQVVVNSQAYRVSIYSSHSALEFIASKPLNTQMPIKFKGVVKNQELELQIIQAQ